MTTDDELAANLDPRDPTDPKLQVAMLRAIAESAKWDGFDWDSMSDEEWDKWADRPSPCDICGQILDFDNPDIVTYQLYDLTIIAGHSACIPSRPADGWLSIQDPSRGSPDDPKERKAV